MTFTWQHFMDRLGEMSLGSHPIPAGSSSEGSAQRHPQSVAELCVMWPLLCPPSPMGAQLSLGELLKEPQVGLQIIMQLIHPEKFLSWKTDEILPALALPPSYHSCEPSVNALHHLCELRHLRPRSTHCLRGTPAPLSSLQGSLVSSFPEGSLEYKDHVLKYNTWSICFPYIFHL